MNDLDIVNHTLSMLEEPEEPRMNRFETISNSVKTVDETDFRQILADSDPFQKFLYDKFKSHSYVDIIAMINETLMDHYIVEHPKSDFDEEE